MKSIFLSIFVFISLACESETNKRSSFNGNSPKSADIIEDADTKKAKDETKNRDHGPIDPATEASDINNTQPNQLGNTFTRIGTQKQPIAPENTSSPETTFQNTATPKNQAVDIPQTSNLPNSQTVPSESNDANANANIDVNANPPATNPAELANLKLSLSNSTLNVLQNANSTSEITLQPDVGFSEVVGLSIDGLPNNFEATFTDENNQLIDTSSIFVDQVKKISVHFTHKPQVNGEMLVFEKGENSINLMLSAKKDTERLAQTPITINLMSVIAMEVLADPNDPERSMFAANQIQVPMGTALCLINNKKDNLVIHASPHSDRQNPIQRGQCFDKFGGNTLSANEFTLATPCTEEDNDNIYDHNEGRNSGTLRISCVQQF